MLLLVLDVSHPRAQQQLLTVVQVLRDIGCAELPTLLVLNKIDAVENKDDLASLHERPDAASDINARLQAGVVAQVKHCAAGWCRVAGNGFDGWIEQQRLWGVYADEKVD